MQRRFWSYVFPDSKSGCWEWIGFKNNKGYGRMQVASRYGETSHRVSWFIKHGKIPGCTLMLDHLCRNRACCNPDHLEEVDNRTNVLRGESPIAKYASRDRCSEGHVYEDNVKRVNGGRRCRICDITNGRIKNHRRIARLKASGLCIRCGAFPHKLDRVMCPSCLASRTIYYSKAAIEERRRKRFGAV